MYIISSCLCGVNCKYNGKNNLNNKCVEIFKSGEAILVCPEQLGGLSTPRTPAEIQGTSEGIIDGDGKVLDKENIDVTKEFLKGAYETLNIARLSNITKAILKDGSPSCGVNYVYDGNFTGRKIMGKGLTTALLENKGIKVISDTDL